MAGKFVNEEFVKKLCSEEFDGRVPGTKGHDLARDLIKKKFEEYNLDYVIPNTWEQTFTIDSNIVGKNLLAMKKAKEPTDEWVLLGAHYDHSYPSLGANDNAASVAIVMETIKYLEQYETKYNIVLGIFDTEEPPYFCTKSMGSFYFYDNCPLNLDKLKCAIVLDLVGNDVPIKGKEKTIFAVGTDSKNGFYDKVKQSRQQTEELNVYSLQRGYLLSDHIAFHHGEKPYLFLTSGHSWHYHTEHDTFEKLNLEKMSLIADFMKNFILNLETPLNEEDVFTQQDEILEITNFVEIKPEIVSLLGVKDISQIKSALMGLLSSKTKVSLDEIKEFVASKKHLTF